MSSVFREYESGLGRLLESLGRNHPRYTEALTLQARLLENLGSVRLYGDTETRRAERAQILDSLNRLALEEVGESFLELAKRDEATSERAIPHRDGIQRDGSVAASSYNISIERAENIAIGDGATVKITPRNRE